MIIKNNESRCRDKNLHLVHKHITISNLKNLMGFF